MQKEWFEQHEQKLIQEWINTETTQVFEVLKNITRARIKNIRAEITEIFRTKAPLLIHMIDTEPLSQKFFAYAEEKFEESLEKLKTTEDLDENDLKCIRRQLKRDTKEEEIEVKHQFTELIKIKPEVWRPLAAIAKLKTACRLKEAFMNILTYNEIYPMRDEKDALFVFLMTDPDGEHEITKMMIENNKITRGEANFELTLLCREQFEKNWAFASHFEDDKDDSYSPPPWVEKFCREPLSSLAYNTVGDVTKIVKEKGKKGITEILNHIITDSPHLPGTREPSEIDDIKKLCTKHIHRPAYQLKTALQLWLIWPDCDEEDRAFLEWVVVQHNSSDIKNLLKQCHKAVDTESLTDTSNELPEIWLGNINLIPFAKENHHKFKKIQRVYRAVVSGPNCLINQHTRFYLYYYTPEKQWKTLQKQFELTHKLSRETVNTLTQAIAQLAVEEGRNPLYILQSRLLPHLIPHINREELIKRTRKALQNDYLATKAQLNKGLPFETVQKAEKGLCKRKLIAQSDSFQSISQHFKEPISAEDREILLDICSATHKDAYHILYFELPEFWHRLKTEHKTFLRELADFSGSRSETNIWYYLRISYHENTDSPDNRHSVITGDDIQKLHRDLRQFLNMGSERRADDVTLKTIDNTIFMEFRKVKGREARITFKKRFQETWSALITEPDFRKPDDMDPQLFEYLLKELTNYDKFGFKDKGNIAEMIEWYEEAQVQNTGSPIFHPVKLVKRVDTDWKNSKKIQIDNIKRPILLLAHVNNMEFQEEKTFVDSVLIVHPIVSLQALQKKCDSGEYSLHRYQEAETLCDVLVQIQGVSYSDSLEKAYAVLLTAAFMEKCFKDHLIKAEAFKLMNEALIMMRYLWNNEAAADNVKKGTGRIELSELYALAEYYTDLDDVFYEQTPAHIGGILDQTGLKALIKKRRKHSSMSGREFVVAIKNSKKMQRGLLKPIHNTLESEIRYVEAIEAKIQQKMKHPEYMEMRYVLCNGLIDQFAGLIGNACYQAILSRPRSVTGKRGLTKYPEIIGHIRFIEPGKVGKDGSEALPKLQGGCLLMRASTVEEGERIPVFILRADNPSNELISLITAESHLEAIEKVAESEVKRILVKEGYQGKVIIARPNELEANLSMTNRAGVFNAVKERFRNEIHAEMDKKTTKEMRENDLAMYHDTHKKTCENAMKPIALQENINFNGYHIQNICRTVRIFHIEKEKTQKPYEASYYPPKRILKKKKQKNKTAIPSH